ncbi:hypothetical protein D3C75_1213190 [compost metagenome]
MRGSQRVFGGELGKQACQCQLGTDDSGDNGARQPERTDIEMLFRIRPGVEYGLKNRMPSDHRRTDLKTQQKAKDK